MAGICGFDVTDAVVLPHTIDWLEVRTADFSYNEPRRLSRTRVCRSE